MLRYMPVPRNKASAGIPQTIFSFIKLIIVKLSRLSFLSFGKVYSEGVNFSICALCTIIYKQYKNHLLVKSIDI
jgi:hypothetical protein